MIGFNKKRGANDLIDGAVFGADLDNEKQERLIRLRKYWNFYEGYHWEGMPEQSSPEITVNYCRAFIDKFVSFELGKAFTFSTHKDLKEEDKVTPDGRTLFEYLEDVWEDNNQYLFAIELGQMKSITGDAWVQVRYREQKDLLDADPFNEYPDGRLELLLMTTSSVFPEYDPHNKGRLTKLTIMYSFERNQTEGFFKSAPRKEKVIFKQEWTNDEVVTRIGKDEPQTIVNKYGVIPFVQIKNIPVAGRNEGRSDLEDIVPINFEYNLKKSNFSEILDYHAAPVTIVYGAKVGNLEKGANKMWGGLAKDAKVENLELRSDLNASTSYARDLKTAMCEVGGIPETVLGGATSVSNTSGVALQYINLPLIEKTRVKRACTEDGIEILHKMIILVSMLEGLITKPADISTRDFFHTEVSLPDTLPKDAIIELQQLQTEMRMGIESREGALKRLGRENIENILAKVAEDMETNPEFYGIAPDDKDLNSGILNGQTPIEQLRIEMEGKNG